MRALLLLVAIAAQANEALVKASVDRKLTVAQRNDACYALRGDGSADVVRAMRELLADEEMQACAARNLVVVRADEALRAAAQDSEAGVRSAAVNALGEIGLLEDLAVYAKAAKDSNMRVQVAALNALSKVTDRAVLPVLLQLAKAGDGVGLAALEQAIRFRDPEVLGLARQFISQPDLPSRLAAMRVLADMGELQDLAILRTIAAQDEEVNTGGRGFGFLPSINVARVAQATIAKIVSREKTAVAAGSSTRPSDSSRASVRK